MKAFEVTGKLNNNKQLLLEDPIAIDTPSRVKVILIGSKLSNYNAIAVN